MVDLADGEPECDGEIKNSAADTIKGPVESLFLCAGWKDKWMNEWFWDPWGQKTLSCDHCYVCFQPPAQSLALCSRLLVTEQVNKDVAGKKNRLF